MGWECLNCGRANADGTKNCTKCFMDHETATTMTVVKKKRMCDECGHRHRDGIYCHMYVDMPEEDEDEDEVVGADGDDNESEQEDGSDDDLLGLQAVSKVKKPKKEEMKPLKTPKFVKDIRFVRCNCKLGVPQFSRIYEAIPRVVWIGDYIKLMLYDEIMEAAKAKKDKGVKKQVLSFEAEKLPRIETKRKKNYEFAAMLPYILSFIPLGQCCHSAKVSHHWNYGTTLYREYIDVRDAVPWQVDTWIVSIRHPSFPSG